MKLIGIIGAMEVEVASLKEMMTDVTIRTKASMEFNHGYLNGKEVVVVRSGIGKVNAGICTQILVDDYGVDCVINTGIAGSLRNEINIGDIVISTDAVQHDMDVRIFGYPLGEIPQMGVLSFPADEHLAEVADTNRRMAALLSMNMPQMMNRTLTISRNTMGDLMFSVIRVTNCWEMPEKARALQAMLANAMISRITPLRLMVKSIMSFRFPETRSLLIRLLIK